MGTSCGQSPLATCKSEWQTPQACTSISTSCASGLGRATSSMVRGCLNSCRMAAFIASTSKKLGCVTQFQTHGLRSSESLIKLSFALGFCSAQKELDCVSYPLGEFVRSG